jgi:hypothetical protein
MESELHTDGFSNPGTGEIEEVFKTVGIANVWILFKAVEPDQLIAQSVNAIVHRRNQIASPVGPPKRLYSNFIRGIRELPVRINGG